MTITWKSSSNKKEGASEMHLDVSRRACDPHILGSLRLLIIKAAASS